MSVTQIPYSGWQNNLCLQNSHIELIISLDVGPRILSYRTLPGENVFYHAPEQMGRANETEWMIRGGHRFWIAPEHETHTYLPDNTTYPHEKISDHSVRLTTPAGGEWQIRKDLTVELAPEGSGVTLTHTLVNESSASHFVSPWALTVMAPGGISILPQPPLGEHPKDLLPNRALILWPYTDTTDPRFQQGKHFITLRQDANLPPMKFGLAHREKWAGYLLGDQLFIKTFKYLDGANYPDFGCNYESFTNQNMLEIETLGPLVDLAPGASISHEEHWSIFSGINPPPYEDTPSFATWLRPFLPL